MDKENLYTYNWILFSLEKERNSSLRDNMDEPEDIMLSVICQTQNNYNLTLCEKYKIVKLISSKIRVLTTRGRGRGTQGRRQSKGTISVI